jgi:hypothetical protein
VKETAMISTLNELLAKEHTAHLIEQANRWRFRQAARALLRSRRPASADADSVRRVEVRDAVILDAAVAADAYCQRAAAPAPGRRVAA